MIIIIIIIVCHYHNKNKCRTSTGEIGWLGSAGYEEEEFQF